MADERELPPGYHYEYKDGHDGGGSISGGNGHVRSEHWPATRYRRVVGPWEVIREGGIAHRVVRESKVPR